MRNVFWCFDTLLRLVAACHFLDHQSKLKAQRWLALHCFLLKDNAVCESGIKD